MPYKYHIKSNYFPEYLRGISYNRDHYYFHSADNWKDFQLENRRKKNNKKGDIEILKVETQMAAALKRLAWEICFQNERRQQ